MMLVVVWEMKHLVVLYVTSACVSRCVRRGVLLMLLIPSACSLRACVGQARSREVGRLASQFDLFRLLSFYYSSVGGFMNQVHT